MYGTAFWGGRAGYGTIYKFNLDGTGYVPLRNFGAALGDGRNPNGTLIQGPDGMLYGVTERGGSADCGTVFKMDTNGTTCEVVHTFILAYGEGRYPVGPLALATNGALYGVTRDGGSSADGTLFTVRPDGTGYSVLHTFTESDGDGGMPMGLIQGQDGALYGTTYSGGSNSCGTVFRLDLDGTAYAVLHSFGAANGDAAFPATRLTQASDGALYGTTQGLDNNRQSTLFKLNADGTGYTNLMSFKACPSSYPGEMRQGQDGALYGTLALGGSNLNGGLFKVQPDGTGYAMIYSFSFNGGEGKRPCSPLAQGADGELYGVTTDGGGNDSGTLFALRPDGTGFQLLFNFSSSGGDGKQPDAGLLADRDGVLHGTTYGGGAYGLGTLFKLNPDGTGYAMLHEFGSLAGDGAEPAARLVQGHDGLLYGTTAAGGLGAGTVFKISPDGADYAALKKFNQSGSEGNSADGLLQGADGKLYGTAYSGGTNYQGTVFRLSTNGLDFTVLHHFGVRDGASPNDGLIQASDGVLYGTTRQGGSAVGSGTIFKLSCDGAAFQVLYSFGTNANEGPGREISAGLVQGSDGALYGTAYLGSSGQGTVFRLSTNGADFRVIHTFSDPGPYAPVTGVMLGLDGMLYGVAGDYYGKVYRLNLDGTSFSVLCSFNTVPKGKFVQGDDFTLYGVTYEGGDWGAGMVYRLPTPPVTASAPLSLVKPMGEIAEFNVNAAGTPPLAFRWQKGGIPLSDGARIAGTSTSTLRLSDLQLEDAGNYRLVVTSSFGEATSAAARLTIVSPPQLRWVSPTQGGNMGLTLIGASNVIYCLEATTNLTTWTPVVCLTNLNGTTPLTTPGASDCPVRFYRAVWKP